MATLRARTTSNGPAQNANSTGLVVPSGTQVGDLLVYVQMAESAQPLTMLTAGWTQAHQNYTTGQSTLVAWKIATSADLGSTVEASLPGGNSTSQYAQMYAWAGGKGVLGVAFTTAVQTSSGAFPQPNVTRPWTPMYALGMSGGTTAFSISGGAGGTYAPFQNYVYLVESDYQAAQSSGGGPSVTWSTSGALAKTTAMTVQVQDNRPPSNPGTPSVSPNPVNTLGTISWAASTDPDGDPVQYFVELSTDNGATWTRILNNVTNTSATYDFTNVPATTVAKVQVLAGQNPDVGAYSAWVPSAAFTVQHNRTPTAPDQLAPDGNTTLDRTQAQQLTWRFTDPDAGDAQSRFRLEYRVAGSGAAFTVVDSQSVGGGTLNRYTFAAGSLAAASYEWRVTTYDQQGAASPVSASAFFTMANPPAGPTITSPANNATVGATSSVVWSYPSQAAYQVRRVADNAGSPDVATVYEDSGVITSTTVRDRGLTFTVNGRAEHVQVRVQDSGTGLWSTYSSVRVLVAFTTPTVPVLTSLPVPEAGYLALALYDPPPPNKMPSDASSSFEDGTTGGWAIGAPGGVTATNDPTGWGHGSRSLRLAATSATVTDTFVERNLTLAAGTYTFAATVRLTGAVTAPAGTTVDNRRAGVWVSSGGGAYTGLAPNAAGVTRVSTTFPHAGGTVILRLYHGGGSGSPDVWWDAVQLEVGSAATPYYLPSTPATVSHDVFRRLAGAPGLTEQRVATGVGSSWRDYTAVSGQAYTYRAVAKAANGTTSSSADDTDTLTLQGVWLFAVDDPQGTILQLAADGHGRQHTREPEVYLRRFAGRTRPLPEWGPQESEAVSWTTRLRRDQAALLERVWQLARRKRTLCYRDGRGRRVFGVLSQPLQAQDELLGQTVQLAVQATDYTDVV